MSEHVDDPKIASQGSGDHSAEPGEPSEQTAGAGANNPARPSETGGNSIEVGDAIQDVMETD
jgi:hypothetical protein